jgi:hypothetical protein
MNDRAPDGLTLAQVQFNLHRPNQWVTVGVGSEPELTAQAASGYYQSLVSPAGDLPCKVRIHRPVDADEIAAAMTDLAEAAGWHRSD